MVRAGEQSGSLVEVLRRMADHFQQFAEVQAKFTSAMIYPAMVICVGAGIIAFFMTFMMPKFMEIFNGFDVELPLPTRMLIGFQHISHQLLVADRAGRSSCVLILFKRFQASEAGARKIDEWKMKAPRGGQGGEIESVRPVRADARHPAAKRRAGVDGVENHGTSASKPSPQGGHRQNPRGGDGRQNARAAARRRARFSRNSWWTWCASARKRAMCPAR